MCWAHNITVCYASHGGFEYMQSWLLSSKSSLCSWIDDVYCNLTNMKIQQTYFSKILYKCITEKKANL